MINHVLWLTVPALLITTVVVASPIPATSLAGCHWLPALQRLDETPPVYATSGPGQLSFMGLDGALRTAWCGASVSRPTAIVLHITDDQSATPVPCAPGCAHYAFAWRESALLPDCDRPSVQDHALTRAIADASRLVEIISGSNALPDERIGLIGEGYGATVALAVAALQPDRVRFVIAHQPLAITRCWLPDSAAPAAWAELDPEALAPAVTARTLLVGGTEDLWAPAESIESAHDALGGPADIWLLEGLGHCPAAQVPGWENAWQAWAFHGVAPAPSP